MRFVYEKIQNIYAVKLRKKKLTEVLKCTQSLKRCCGF